jgi:hypothetical protein
VPAQRGQAFRLSGIGAANPLEYGADRDEVEFYVVAASRADDLPLVRPPAPRKAVNDAHRSKAQAGRPAAVSGLTRPNTRHGGILRRTMVAPNPRAVYPFASMWSWCCTDDTNSTSVRTAGGRGQRLAGALGPPAARRRLSDLIGMLAA